MAGYDGCILPYHSRFSLLLLVPQVFCNHLTLVVMVVSMKLSLPEPQYGAAISENGGAGQIYITGIYYLPILLPSRLMGESACKGHHSFSFRHTQGEN